MTLTNCSDGAVCLRGIILMQLIFCPSSLYVFDLSFYFENNNNNNNNIMAKLSGVRNVNHDNFFFFHLVYKSTITTQNP